MHWKCMFGLFLLSVSAVRAQEAPAVTEPEYVDQYFALGSGGTLQPLEHGALAHQCKTSNHFISVKSTSSETMPGKASPLRLSAGTHFVVRLYTGDVDPTP